MSDHHEPIVIDPLVQRDDWDCGVACLAMLLGRSYAEVRGCIRSIRPDGLTNRQMTRIAKRLGYVLSHRPHVDEDAVGILDLDRETDDRWEGHFVIFAKGTVYNPSSGQWWMDLDTYLRYSRYRVCGLFVRVG